MTITANVSIGLLSARTLQLVKEELEQSLRDYSMDLNPDTRIVIRGICTELDLIDKLLMEKA